ncbi:hypothetical protein [Helicobacter sp. T3_23-1056]
MFVITSKAFALHGNPTFSSLRAQLVARGNLLFLSLKEIAFLSLRESAKRSEADSWQSIVFIIERIAFLSLRDSRLLLKRLESWQSKLYKVKKNIFCDFSNIDCHAQQVALAMTKTTTLQKNPTP